MVDTVTTKGIAVAATTVARQGYWRGVFRRLLRDPGAYSLARSSSCC